uniref:B box-type domain-containing protein n=1 Tax=Macrostomum lignano TaxID=282301 RepID=A0A1I8I5I6_9PLAT
MSDGAAAELCDLCNRSRQASSRCLDCGKLLCIACRQRHRRVRVTSEHELVDVDRQMELRCERHSDELVRFFCTSCQTTVCIGCTFSSEHAEHTVLKFKDAAQQKADELAEFSRLSGDKLRQVRSALQLARNIEAHLTDTETAIREAANQQVAAIKAAQQILLEELRSFYDCCSNLLSGRHEIAAALRDLTEVSSFSELVERGRYSESLMLAPRVAATLARYTNYQPPTPPPTPRRFRLLFLDAASSNEVTTPAITLGRLEMQRLTASCCFSESGSTAGSCVDVTSLSSSDSGSSCDLTADAGEEEASVMAESFFTYDNSTLRSSVCRSLTTDTLVASSVDAECQTDFHLVVQLGFAKACRHEFLQNVIGASNSLVATDELDQSSVTVCQQDLLLTREQCTNYLEPVLQIALPCSETKGVFCNAVTTWQHDLDSVAILQTEPRRRQTSEDEVRVCSVMFSSMESNDCDSLELNSPPKLLSSVGCQGDKRSSELATPKTATVAATQTPHLPRRRDLADGCSQTAQLASFSRNIQVEADSEERATQTVRLRRWDESRVDRATQWEPGPARTYQEFYRSGRLVRVVGCSGDVCNSLALSPRATRRHGDASSAASKTAEEPQLHQLTQMMKSKPQPEVLPLGHSSSTCAAGVPSTSGARPAASGVKFPKPTAKLEETMSSLDRLRNFCSRLRQRRTGLGKQKVVLLTDQ